MLRLYTAERPSPHKMIRPQRDKKPEFIDLINKHIGTQNKKEVWDF